MIRSGGLARVARGFVCAGLVALAVLLAGCGGRVGSVEASPEGGERSAESTVASAGSDAADDQGYIVAQVELPFGTVVSTFNYELSGAGSVLLPSMPTAVDGPMVAFRISGVPAARGYTLALTAWTRDGGECVGSASFNVAAGQPTVVILIATCQAESDAG